MQMLQLEIKSTFLNGNLEEELYIAQPEGFVLEGHKALYRLRQAARVWNEALCNTVA